jgi:hypothetical protein
MERYALTFGYRRIAKLVAGTDLTGAVMRVRDRVMKRRRNNGGRWQANFVELRLALFAMQRAFHWADWYHKAYTGADSALVLSPSNARSQIEGLITHAQHSLDVYAEELADLVVRQDLTQAVHRGVSVRLVTTVNDKIGGLAGVIPVVRRSKALYIHFIGVAVKLAMWSQSSGKGA